MMSFSLFDEMRLPDSPVPAGRSEPEACTFCRKEYCVLFSENKPCAAPAQLEELRRCEGGCLRRRLKGCPYPFIIAFTPPNTQNP